MFNNLRPDQRDILIWIVIMIACFGFFLGHLSGLRRAALSAELVSYNETGYEIQYDLEGTHYYTWGN